MNPNFEKYIHQSLKNQEEFVDAEAIWEGVEPHVQAPKKRRRFFWWFFYGASVVVVTMGLWTYSQKEFPLLEEEMVGNEVISSSDRTESEIVEKTSNKELIRKSENKNNESDININAIVSESIEKEEIQLTNKNALKSDDLLVDISAQKNIRKITPNNNQITSKKRETTFLSDQMKLEKPIEETSFIELLQDGNYNPLSKEPQSSMGVVPFEEEEKVEAFLIENLNALELSSTIGEVSSEIKEDLIPAGVKLITPVHKQPNWKFAIGLHAGIGKVNSDWTFNEERDNSEYFATRKSTEKQLESSSIGLSFSAQMKNNISFRTGLEYHRIARRFNYEENLTTYDTIPNAILKLYVNATTGDTIIDRGEFINTHTESYEKETYNYFHRLDIPLFVGYHFKKGRFLLGVEAGVFANVLLRKKGELVGNTEGRSFYDLKKDDAQWYKTKVGVTPALQMNFGYEFAPGVEAYCSPYYRFKTTYTTSANSVKETYSDVGVQLGVKYWLR